MAHIVTTDDWRWGFERSRIIVLVWSPAPAYAQTQREKLAYAMALGKPIRLLVLAPARVPEDLCAGYDDFEVARVTDQACVPAQVQAWMAAMKEDPDAHVCDLPRRGRVDLAAVGARGDAADVYAGGRARPWLPGSPGLRPLPRVAQRAAAAALFPLQGPGLSLERERYCGGGMTLLNRYVPTRVRCWECPEECWTLNELSTHHLDCHERPLLEDQDREVWEVVPPRERYVVPNHKAQAAHEWYGHARNGVPYA